MDVHLAKVYVSSCSTTEEDSQGSMEGDDTGSQVPDRLETIIKAQVDDWLSIHGSKLFALETSKFLAKANRNRR